MAPRQDNNYGAIELPQGSDVEQQQQQQQQQQQETVPLVVTGGNGIAPPSPSFKNNNNSSSSTTCRRSLNWFLLDDDDDIHHRRCRRWIIMIVATVILAVMVVLSMVHGSRSSSSSGTTFGPSPPPDSSSSSSTPKKPPFSVSPVDDKGLIGTERAKDASPSEIWGDDFLVTTTASEQKQQAPKQPLPTNSWYLNLVSHHAAHQPDDSTSAYTIPYIIDTAAGNGAGTSSSTSNNNNDNKMMTGGIRVHWPVLQANSKNIQMVDDYKNSIALGSADQDLSGKYTVNPNEPLSPLGVSLLWESSNSSSSGGSSSGNGDGDAEAVKDTNNKSSSSNNSNNNTKNMSTHIVRGMPYATMHYQGGVLPVLYSYNGLANGDVSIQVDGGADDSDDHRGKSNLVDNSSSDSNTDGDVSSSSTTTTSSSSSSSTTISSSTTTNDDNKVTVCGIGKPGKTFQVKREIQMHFINSDFTWIVFFSKPVTVQCAMSEGDEKLRDFQLNVVSYGNVDDGDDGDDEKDSDSNDNSLTVRLALLDQCTTGKSNIQLHCVEKEAWKDPKGYLQLLRDNVHVFPTSPQLDFDYSGMNDASNDSSDSSSSSSSSSARITIDWAPQTTKVSSISKSSSSSQARDDDSLLMFALPHHQDSLDVDMITQHCINTFHGNTCLVKGESWRLTELMGSPMSFTAARPPEAASIPALAKALEQDIHYRLSSNLLRGAADTYFSGKILARLARVIVIASEMKKLAAGQESLDELKELYTDIDEESLIASMEAAESVNLPSNREIAAALEQLKEGVQIWLSPKAEAPFVYDKSWGGLVNCGCRYTGKDQYGVCNNTFPDCPALEDVNEDFGNGYYNDHHYHLGYHMYAAAVAAKFDPLWGEQHFSDVLLYVRDFANPSDKDTFFPQFRQKDWFLGSSWASGIVSAENSPHGRNEESSSEAISAYEAVALFGSAMVDAFAGNSKSNGDQLKAARLVRDAGQLLTATEVHATNRYWHVWSSATHNRTYPEAYQQPVVGMLYDTMASFQTWFAPEAVVSYGIQLLPFTPVAERRDDPEWAAELYPLYEKSCMEAGDFCVDNGWSILQAGLLATTGDRKAALKQALAVPDKVFQSQGGVGNSLSNTIWYIATRKDFENTSG